MSEKQLAVKPSAEITAAGMLQTVISQGVTEQSVAVLRELCALQREQEEQGAKRSFARAFAALQSEMPAVQACKAVPNRDGTTRYKFAPYEEIMRQVQPILQKHGFSVTFDTSFGEARMKVACILMHEEGHERRSEFAVRIGSGPPGSNEMQADGAAKTYAKRGALCDALNIVIEHDTDGNDARGLGKNITSDQAESLKRRVKATGSDEVKFLKFAAASSYEEITEDKYGMLDKFLTSKERSADGSIKA